MFIIIQLLILLAIAFFTLSERKILGLSQLRLGPIKIGWLGIIQPVLDGLKLLNKVNILSYKSMGVIIKLFCTFLLGLSLFSWLVIPFNIWSSKISSLFFILLILSILSYINLLLGWMSISSFGFLGRNRNLAQVLRFEVTLRLIVFLPFLINNKFSWRFFNSFSRWIRLILQLIFFIIILVDRQRSPMDLSEGERELVSGYNTEFSGLIFITIFLTEYSSLIWLVYIFSLMWIRFLVIKWCLILFSLILIRRCFPRIRYDLVISFIWTKILPGITVLWLFIVILKF